MSELKIKTIKKEKTGTKKLVLFDAHAILHRAYHALPDFTSASGEPTGGLYGLSTMLMRIIDELKPDYLAACYDRAEATFRKEAYQEYKANRKKADEELISQIIRSREVFTAFGIPIYDKAGFEADDMIGTIVEQTKDNKNLQVIIASGDMDTMQLIDDKKVLVYTIKKGINDTILYDEAGIKERFGFEPKLLADYKGLRGDPSDNIIGIPGIGEKTATDLVINFGTIENLYKKLKKDEEVFKKAGIKERIIGLLKNGEEEALFSKMLATIRRDAPITYELPARAWAESFDISKVEKIFSELSFKSLMSRVKSMSVVKGASVAEETKGEKTETAEEKELIKRVGIALWLIDSTKTTPTREDILDFAGTKNLNEAEQKIIKELYHLKLDAVYEKIELPLIPIIAKAEARGILIDKKYLAKLSKEYHDVLSGLEKKIYKAAGKEFNINSPKQLGEVLFDELNISLKGLRKTAGGARSTKESELIKIKDVHPIISPILEYREYQKLLSTYIDNIPKMTDENDRLHTSLNQAGTTTGRMSSNNPNLQNIPAREGAGVLIRNAFIAGQGHKLLSFDYSQIEMRILAELSGDADLMQVFKEGKDAHTSVASRVFGVPEAEVTKDMRRQAKVINFGIIYGMGVNALKTNLKTTREEAQKFYDNYFATFPSIREYFDNVISSAYQKGYTETLFGRRRYFPELKSRLPFLRAGAERMVMNAPLQGTAADLVKLAMIKVSKELEQAGLSGEVHLLLQIHDELMFEVEEGAIKKAALIITAAMESVGGLGVPLTVHFSSGHAWGEMEK